MGVFFLDDHVFYVTVEIGSKYPRSHITS